MGSGTCLQYYYFFVWRGGLGEEAMNREQLTIPDFGAI